MAPAKDDELLDFRSGALARSCGYPAIREQQMRDRAEIDGHVSRT